MLYNLLKKRNCKPYAKPCSLYFNRLKGFMQAKTPYFPAKMPVFCAKGGFFAARQGVVL